MVIRTKNISKIGLYPRDVLCLFPSIYVERKNMQIDIDADENLSYNKNINSIQY